MINNKRNKVNLRQQVAEQAQELIDEFHKQATKEARQHRIQIRRGQHSKQGRKHNNCQPQQQVGGNGDDEDDNSTNRTSKLPASLLIAAAPLTIDTSTVATNDPSLHNKYNNKYRYTTVKDVKAQGYDLKRP